MEYQDNEAFIMNNDDDAFIDDEELNNDYEPNEEEIKDYAQYLGIDIEQDSDLLYIAREGLKAPLPELWKGCRTNQGDIYYFNIQTGESRWDHPLDDYYRQQYQIAKDLKSTFAHNNNTKQFDSNTSINQTINPKAINLIIDDIINNDQPQTTRDSNTVMTDMPINTDIMHNEIKSIYSPLNDNNNNNSSMMLSYSSNTATNNNQTYFPSANISLNINPNNNQYSKLLESNINSNSNNPILEINHEHYNHNHHDYDSDNSLDEYELNDNDRFNEDIHHDDGDEGNDNGDGDGGNGDSDRSNGDEDIGDGDRGNGDGGNGDSDKNNGNGNRGNGDGDRGNDDDDSDSDRGSNNNRNDDDNEVDKEKDILDNMEQKLKKELDEYRQNQQKEYEIKKENIEKMLNHQINDYKSNLENDLTTNKIKFPNEKHIIHEHIFHEYDELLNNEIYNENKHLEVNICILKQCEDKLIEDNVKESSEMLLLNYCKRKQLLNQKIDELLNEKKVKEAFKEHNKHNMNDYDLEYSTIYDEFCLEKQKITKEFFEKLDEYEANEVKKQQLCIESFVKDLKLRLERERELTLSNIKQQEEDSLLRKQDQIEYWDDIFSKNSKKLKDQYINQLKLEEEQAYKAKNDELEGVYRSKIEYEIKGKMVLLEQEKVCYEESLVDDLIKKKIELEGRYENEKKELVRMEDDEGLIRLKEEINKIKEEILSLEKINEEILKCIKEAERMEKLIHQKNDIISQLKMRIIQIETEKNIEHANHNEKIKYIQNQTKKKNELLIIINNLHKKIDTKEKEIENQREKLSKLEKSYQSRLFNETFNNQISNTTFGVSKILKEVEEIKLKIKKVTEKKSLSTGRLGIKADLSVIRGNINDDYVSKKSEFGESDEDEFNTKNPKIYYNTNKEGHFPRVNRRYKIPIKPKHDLPLFYPPVTLQKSSLSSIQNHNTTNNFEVSYEKWRKIIENEHLNLKEILCILKARKDKTKELHDEIKEDQVKYKNLGLLDESSRKGNVIDDTIKTRLSISKKELNIKIKRYNDDVYALKENEKLLKQKNYYLSLIESNICNSFQRKQINEDELKRLLEKYQEIMIFLPEKDTNNTNNTNNTTHEISNNSGNKETSRFQIFTPRKFMDLKENSQARSRYTDRYADSHINNENDKSIQNQQNTLDMTYMHSKLRSQSGNPLSTLSFNQTFEKSHLNDFMYSGSSKSNRFDVHKELFNRNISSSFNNYRNIYERSFHFKMI